MVGTPFVMLRADKWNKTKWCPVRLLDGVLPSKLVFDLVDPLAPESVEPAGITLVQARSLGSSSNTERT
jgi:hypothetical protein